MPDSPNTPPAAQKDTTDTTTADDKNLSDEEFPPITPGGSLMLAWQLRDRPVLLVGGGAVAASRLDHLLNASAQCITLIAPLPLHPLISHRLSTHPTIITHHPRLFLPSDLTSPVPSLILTAVDDPAVSSAIHALASASNIPINVADVPPLCDFYFGAIHRSGPLQIMVSTNGNGPRLAASIRDHIAASLPSDIATAITNIGILRKKLRDIATGTGVGEINRRMGYMTKVCDAWSYNQLAAMTEGDMRVLLSGYPDTIRSFEDVRKLDTLMAGVKLAEEQDSKTDTT
ncbi:hypothetical protein ABW21_db0203556 [Orbilia brochopaga]|nr:hypothetical protein ABW21_db0203556 [Drechslerella brochopaga]